MHCAHYFDDILFKQCVQSKYLGKNPIIIAITEVNFKPAEFHSYDKCIESFAYYM